MILKRREPSLKELVTKLKRSFYTSSYYYYCEKPVCTGYTVTQFARESFGPCPLVRECRFFVEGRRSRVECLGSRVNCRGSKVKCRGFQNFGDLFANFSFVAVEGFLTAFSCLKVNFVESLFKPTMLYLEKKLENLGFEVTFDPPGDGDYFYSSARQRLWAVQIFSLPAGCQTYGQKDSCNSFLRSYSIDFNNTY